MKLAGRMSGAIEILESISATNRPVSAALRDWGQSHRFAGSGDRAAIGNLVYDVMRKKSSHAYAMGSDTPRAAVLSVVVRDWGIDCASLNEQFDGDRFAPEPISAEERTLLTAPDPFSNAPDHQECNIPEWLVADFQSVFGDRWQEEAEALSNRPPLDMRVNALKSVPERVLKSLSRFSPLQLDGVENALRIEAGQAQDRTANVQADEAFLKGWLEVQDAGSQIVSQLCAPVPGEHILDYCAGAGGKTLALAALTNNKGQIFAYDANRSRLAPIYDRLKRNGVRNTQVRPPNPNALHDIKFTMDKVVVDAPCTGTGTWRRHPDTKWRLTADQVSKRVAEQREVLDEAKDFVKAGGELIYITCSLLPAENKEQIQRFVADNGLFAPIDMNERWAGGLSHFDAAPIFDDFGATLSPRGTGTDGFYIAILKRQSD